MSTSTSTTQLSSSNISSQSHPPWLTQTALTGLTGSIIGASVATLQGQPVIRYSVNMGVMWSGFGLVFWSTRTQLTPLVQSELISYLPFASSHSFTRSSVTSFYASTISGFLTGGLMGALLRGPSKAGRAACTISFLAAISQVSWNTVNWYRKDILIRKGRIVDENDHDNQGNRIENVKDQRTIVQKMELGIVSLLKKLPSWSPIRMVSDEEYLDRLSKQKLDLDHDILKQEDLIKRLKSRIAQETAK
ncbi:hypothetical protein BKA69DRAFT_1172586 [Paraphysoderma sedebokerense]|nr:hypothetical protein BKA69DRAFT_1035753 [Paraphysoderma sedebokerense]KAI9145112.1 hypothetical protein BKA69DRAFT_1172586 [Paraphysoderma sedebokerense]